MVILSNLRSHYNIQVEFDFDKIDKNSLDVHTEGNLLYIKAADSDDEDNIQSVELYLPRLSTEEPNVAVTGKRVAIKAYKNV